MLDADIFGDEGAPEDKHSRDFLEECIRDYNREYATNFSTDGFYDYFTDLQKRIKSKGVDLVLVVNMFLTGFGSPRLNTLFVDKNLRYHGLIQVYSRTNRLLNSDKPHGNIVSFRNLKEATDKALALYADEDAVEVVFKKPYEEQKREFDEKLKILREKAPDLTAIDELRSEEEKAAFVTAFRDASSRPLRPSPNFPSRTSGSASRNFMTTKASTSISMASGASAKARLSPSSTRSISSSS